MSNPLLDDKYNSYLFEYRYNGYDWGFEISARNAEEAKERLKAMTWARYNGQIYAKIPVYGGGIILKIMNRLRRLFSSDSKRTQRVQSTFHKNR